VGSIRRTLAVAELADRRGQRAVEDEFLDELGRLQQRVALAGGLGQILVEVAEEAGVPVGVGEVVHQRPARRVHRLPELRSAIAASPLMPRRKTGLCASSKKVCSPGSVPASRKAASR
jgi:hypothetical protein